MWSQFTKAEYSIATTSCTSALFLSIDSLNLEEDDEVIVPALSWISTANVVENVGCKTVFCDIDLSTFNINLDDLRSKITNNTKAIIPVHLFGYPIDIEIIKGIIGDRKIHIIEDAACGFGSYVDDIHVGTKGTFGCFSFHPRKAISTGEGGMITLNDKKYLISDLDEKSKVFLNDLTRTVMEYKELLRNYNQSLTLTNTYASGLKTEVEKIDLPEPSNEDSPSITIADKKYDGSNLPDTVKAYVSELLRANKNKTNIE